MSPAETTKETKILVGPNILVSRDADVPHVELMVASHPKNPGHLLGTAMTYTRLEGGLACKTYASFDGGYTWTDSVPEPVEFGSIGGVDPQAAFGLHGTAYFAGIIFRKDEAGHRYAGVHVYRSEDGGKTWQKPVYLRGGDHPVIVVDQTYGRYAGRIYIGLTYLDPYPNYVVGVFRSDDDGRTFVGPVVAATGGGIGINAMNMLIFSDGTLFVPYSDFQVEPEKRKASTTSTLWFVTSSDGGISFSAPTKIHEQHRGNYTEEMKLRLSGRFDWTSVPAYAIDTQSTQYQDRLYVVWNDRRFGNFRILFSYSSDRGKTWSKPKLISQESLPEASQYQTTIAVNKQGIVGITWFETQAPKNPDRYHLYFSASVDGGESFLPTVRVSSEPSFPLGTGNLRPFHWISDSTEKFVVLRFFAVFYRWPQGGDYMGLTTDLHGTFHPFWADSRSGTFQVWTSQIRVLAPDGKETPKETAPPQKVKTSLNQKVQLVFDPTAYNPETQEMVVPIRLRNVSQETLYGPFTVEVKRLVEPDRVKQGYEIAPPRILNAANGKTGEGATFDYSAALRDFESLEPGGLSEAVKWRFKVLGPAHTLFYIEAEVRGFVPQPK